jgi:hypothetical protein
MPRIVLALGIPGWQGTDLINRSYEAIASAGEGRDDAATQQLAQTGYVDRKIAFLDHPSVPNQLQQFILQDYAVATLDQCEKKIEWARAEVQVLAVREQRPAVRDETKSAGHECFCRSLRDHQRRS